MGCSVAAERMVRKMRGGADTNVAFDAPGRYGDRRPGVLRQETDDGTVVGGVGRLPVPDRADLHPPATAEPSRTSGGAGQIRTAATGSAAASPPTPATRRPRPR